MTAEADKMTIAQSIQEDFDVLKTFLLKIVPRMSLLSNKRWKILKNRCNNRYYDIENIKTINNYIFIEYAIGCYSPNAEVKRMCQSFISAFNNLVETSIIAVNKALEKKLFDIIQQIFITGENNTEQQKNCDFKNRLNELMAFSYLSQCENFDIVNFEETLPNGKSIDFLLKNKKTEERIGIEVLTLQAIDSSRQDDNSTLTIFLDDRIRNKYEDKTSTIQSLSFQLFIMPIVEHNEGLEKFMLTTTLEYAMPMMISCLNGASMELIEANKYLASVQ